MTLCGWEGNRRSGVALAMRHRLSGLSTYGLNGQCLGDEHLAYAPLGYGPFTFFYLGMHFTHYRYVIAVAAISSQQWGDDMASAEREPITGSGGRAPSGVQGQSPWSRGQEGEAP